MSRRHVTSAYRDGFQWVVFCQVCGKEEPFESEECPGDHVEQKAARLLDKTTEQK